MADYDELKKKIDAFLKEVKAFSTGIPGTNADVEGNQTKYSELRAQQKAFIKEVNEFQPAKKVFFLDKKKSGLVKSLQEELTKSSKLMEKHNIPVPAEPEAAEEAKTDPPVAESAKETVGDAVGQTATETTADSAKVTAESATKTTPSAPAPAAAEGSSASAKAAAVAATPAKPEATVESKTEPDQESEEFDEEEEEEDEEEYEEEEEEQAEAAAKPKADQAPVVATAAAQQTSGPTPVPRQHATENKEAKKNGAEEEEEEEDDMQSLASDEPNIYVVLRDFDEKEPDLLRLVAGEQLVVVRMGTNGWWLARNSRNQEGLVPSTLLKAVEESEPADEEFDDEDEYEDEEEEEEDEELSEQAPTALQSVIQQDDKLINSTSQLSPGLPTGFRNSTLAKWFYQGDHNLCAHLAPKLSRSCLGYRDLLLDPISQKMKPFSSRLEKVLQLQKCIQMPTDLPVKVLDRFVRLCLFDGHGPVSNVLTVRAVLANRNDERVWTFTNRLGESTPCLEFGEVYVRYNYAPNHVRLLLEATVVCPEAATAEGQESSGVVELSIGHATVSLFDEQGGPMPAKSLDLQLEGGTPFEQQIEVDPNLSKAGSQSSGLFRGPTNRQPRIQLKFTLPSREVKEFMDTCPGTIIGSLANLQLHSIYRQLLASELGQDNIIVERECAPVYGPCLVQFPVMADQPDLMDLIRRRWNDFAKRDRAYRKPLASEAMKQEFIRIVKSVYLLNQVKDFQPFVFGNKNQEQARTSLIQDFQRRTATDLSGISFSLSNDLIVEAFDMREVALQMLGQHCVPVIPVAAE